ncbi:hypothetical protein [Nitriliruptor alkaliphilus]|uniref:hypothetical protein n=1 Tax=Nitriliruptor alkaliphilus TaxID=427918 RepID=UPI0006971704|nr:hypothetical protein [Nitriliruptor alkaliphilus]
MPAPGRGSVVRALIAALLVLLVGCTGEPAPTPTPTPTADETADPAPSGVQVAVIVPAASDPAAASFLDAERQLARLEADRVGDVASVRVIVPDDPDFVPDLAALVADGGADLVCVLGSSGRRTVTALAERFPATRFCALAAPRENLPDNVDLFDVAYEELGHVLGVAADAAGAGGSVGVVLGDDDDPRARRRAGLRAALAGGEVSVDTIVRDPSEATELARTTDEEPLATVVVDVADAGLATVVAASASSWIGPRGVTVDASAGSAVVRWWLRADVIVGAAVDRLVQTDRPDELSRLGFEQEVFALTFGEGTNDAVRAVTDVAADEFARGVRDPLEPRAAEPADEDDEDAATGPGTTD